MDLFSTPDEHAWMQILTDAIQVLDYVEVVILNPQVVQRPAVMHVILEVCR